MFIKKINMIQPNASAVHASSTYPTPLHSSRAAHPDLLNAVPTSPNRSARQPLTNSSRHLSRTLSHQNFTRIKFLFEPKRSTHLFWTRHAHNHTQRSQSRTTTSHPHSSRPLFNFFIFNFLFNNFLLRPVHITYTRHPQSAMRILPCQLTRLQLYLLNPSASHQYRLTSTPKLHRPALLQIWRTSFLCPHKISAPNLLLWPHNTFKLTNALKFCARPNFAIKLFSSPSWIRFVRFLILVSNPFFCDQFLLLALFIQFCTINIKSTFFSSVFQFCCTLGSHRGSRQIWSFFGHPGGMVNFSHFYHFQHFYSIIKSHH